MKKSEIRSKILKKRTVLTGKQQESLSKRILRRLEGLEVFKRAKVILLYFSHHGEVQTNDFIKKWDSRKKFMLPRLQEGDTFLALSFSSADELEKNHFGIPEPRATKQKQPNPDLIIVPGVAFDRRGNRIGMGKGYYDRFLAKKKGIPRVALAYSEQVLDSIPKEPYDESVDWIITEDEAIRC